MQQHVGRWRRGGDTNRTGGLTAYLGHDSSMQAANKGEGNLKASEGKGEA